MAEIPVPIINSGSGPVTVGNFTEFMTTLKLLAPEMYAETRTSLGVVMEDVAQDARLMADRQGFTPPGTSGRGTGALIGSIRSGLTTRKGYIVDTANNVGYPYPKRWEYADGGARSFFRSAINESIGKIYAGVEEALNRVIDRWNSGQI